METRPGVWDSKTVQDTKEDGERHSYDDATDLTGRKRDRLRESGKSRDCSCKKRSGKRDWV